MLKSFKSLLGAAILAGSATVLLAGGCTGDPSPPSTNGGNSNGTASFTKIKTISHGEEVVLEDHLVPGVYTVFEFGADW